jgi:hypothetical protein
MLDFLLPLVIFIVGNTKAWLWSCTLVVMSFVLVRTLCTIILNFVITNLIKKYVNDSFNYVYEY